jgi:hypothetical protein
MANEAQPHAFEAYEKITKDVLNIEKGRHPALTKPAYSLLKGAVDYIGERGGDSKILKLDDEAANKLTDIGARVLFNDYLFPNAPKEAKDAMLASKDDKDFVDWAIFKQLLGLDKKRFATSLKDAKTLSALNVQSYVKPLNDSMGKLRTQYTVSKMEEKTDSAEGAANFHAYMTKVTTDNKASLEDELKKAAAEGVKLGPSPNPHSDLQLWLRIVGGLSDDYSAIPKKPAA